MDTLYYDGRCPLCRREMAWLDRLKRDSLSLVDIHALEGDAPLPRADMLAVLHLRTGDGHWVTGVDATVRAWRHTPVGLFWAWLAWGPIKPIATRVYRRWAAQRYARLYGCRTP